MKALHSYLLCIIAVALMTGLFPKILPSGIVKRVFPFIGMLLMITAVLSPIMELQAEDLAKSISGLYIQTQERCTGIEVTNREILSMVIQQNIESYIHDRAQDLGATLTAVVTLDDSSEYPYPSAVRIEGAFTDEQQALISRMLKNDLSIPMEKQEWIRQ